MAWYFVDDRSDEARAISAAFSRSDPALAVTVMSPSEARSELLSGAVVPEGVLVDVDLSGIPGEKGSGPGIAQDVRVGQRAGRLREFAVVRFASRARVRESIDGDPGSDDLFDLKIQKEAAARDYPSVVQMLSAISGVYEQLQRSQLEGDVEALTLLGLTPEASHWGHRALISRLRANRQVGVHVAAGTLLRTLLLVDGLLIPEDLLAARLGLDKTASASWADILGSLSSVEYRGVGNLGFRRWWARGLDQWWLENSRSERSLLSLTIAERVELLRQRFRDVEPLQMPAGSAGHRPWSRCTLHAEVDPPEFVAVDPLMAVRVRPLSDLSPWTDAQYASRGASLRAERTDPRLDASDVALAKRERGGI